MTIKSLLNETFNPHTKTKFLSRPPNLYLNFETEGELYTADEYTDCLVVLDNVLETKQRDFSSFLNPW